MSDDAAAGNTAPLARRLWRAVSLGAAVVVPVVTVLTIVIPMAVESGNRTTSQDTFAIGDAVVSGAPAADPALAAFAAPSIRSSYSPADGADIPTDHIYRFEIPLDAPWETFPLVGGNGECSDQQREWLRENEVQVDGGSGWTPVQNTATDGGALTIQNVRVEGEFHPQDPVRFYVQCWVGGRGAGAEFVSVRVTLGDSAPGTVLFDNTSTALPVGGLFSATLGPGELLPMYLDVDSLQPDQDFYGRIIADVVAGGETSQVVLQEGWLWRADPAVTSVFGFWHPGEFYVSGAEGYLECVWGEYDGWYDPSMWEFKPDDPEIDYPHSRCTPAELVAAVQAAAAGG